MFELTSQAIPLLVGDGQIKRTYQAWDLAFVLLWGMNNFEQISRNFGKKAWYDRLAISVQPTGTMEEHSPFDLSSEE